MRQIQGKAALVTGAASGIGRAIALRLADEGARLYMLDVNESALAETADEGRARGVEVLTRICDVGEPAQVTAAVQFILAEWDGVDILVNNAGLTYYGLVNCMTAEHWERLLRVNLHAPIQFTRELLPAMLARREAHVLNVASICGLVGLARVVAYTTSKFGLVGFSEALRHECGPMGLGVTALCPGLVDTNLFATAPRGIDRQRPTLPPRWTLTTADAVAQRAVRAIYRNQHLVVLQPGSRLLYWAKRFVPRLLDWAYTVRRRPHAGTGSQPAPAPADHSPRRAA